MKMDGLSFQLEVIVMEAEGLKSVPNKRIIYCTIEVEGEGKLQTDHVEASNPQWNTQGDFTLNHPLPTVKIKMYMENAGMLALEDKELGKITLKPTPSFTPAAEWYSMSVSKNSIDRNLRIKLICRMECPSNMKHSGFLYAMGKITWKKWKRRYFVLFEVAEKMYTLCSYKEKKSDNTESILLDGYCIDYIEKEKAQLMMGTQLKGGNYFFSAVKEGDNVLLAAEEEKECRAWVAALYKSTGQANKPIFPQSNSSLAAGKSDAAKGADKMVKR